MEKKKEKESKPITLPSCSPQVGWGGGSVGMAGQRGWSVICLYLGTNKSFCGLGFLCEGKTVGGGCNRGAGLDKALTVGPNVCV